MSVSRARAGLVSSIEEYDIKINVGDLTVKSVGDYTVKKIIDILEEENVVEENKTVLLDFEGLSIIGASHRDNVGLLLRLIIMYNCSVEGLSDLVKEEIKCYLHSDKYIIDNVGIEEYIKVFKENIKKGRRNRLRVKDNFYTKDFIKKELIIDVGFKDNNYYYLQLKPCYTEPKHILTEDFNELFDIVLIHQSDLTLNETRIREPVGLHEYEVVNLLGEILKEKGIDEYISQLKYNRKID